jgi:predicted metal-binding membrane protein
VAAAGSLAMHSSLARPRAPLDILRAVGPLIGVAWLVALVLQLTGNAAALHHHALIDGVDGRPAPPLWLGIPAFLVAWQLMIAAMMLPASVEAIDGVAVRLRVQPAAAIGGFLAAYFLAWTGFGMAAFLGDIGLHGLVHASAWLAAHQWLIPTGSLALAGAYQLLPVRRRALEACRHPRAGEARRGGVARAGFMVGLAHAADCLVCSWALMLLLFAAGVDNLAWMAGLTCVMAYEALGRHGAKLGLAFGVALLGLAGLTAIGAITTL